MERGWPVPESTLSLRFAKAHADDLEMFQRLVPMLNAIAEGQMLPKADGEYDDEDPEWLDVDDPEHCQLAVKRLFSLLDEGPGAVSRILFAAQWSLTKDVFDPAHDHLAWHPDLAAVVGQRKPQKKGRGGAME